MGRDGSMLTTIVSASFLLLSVAGGLEDQYEGFRIPYEGWACPELFELPSSRESFFDNYISKRQPVVIRDAVRLLGWAARPEEWTDKFLCEIAGEEKVSVVVRQSSKHRSSGQRTSMRLCDFIREKDPLKYITQFQGPRRRTSPLPPWMTKFTPYFKVPYFYEYDFSSVNMWLGYPHTAGTLGAAATTNAHFDGVDNLFTVLSGQKTFHIWDPTSARGLYTFAPVERIARSGDLTMGDPPNPDLPKSYRNPYTLQRPKTSQVPLHISNATSDPEVNRLFPMYGSQTRGGVCVVNPGDMIYFPGCFFHEVNSKGRHLGINFWTKMRNLKGKHGDGADVSGMLSPRRPTYNPQSGLEVSPAP